MFKKIIGRFFAIIGFITVSLIVIIVVLGIYHMKPITVPENAVLTINLDKLTITEAPAKGQFHSLFLGPSTSLFEVTHAIDHAAKNPHIKGLSMRIGVMSLGPTQIQELRDAILRFRKHGKQTFFHTQTFGELSPATLPYYLATAFDQIFVQPSGFLILTGLFTELPFAAKALDNIGVKARIGTREEYKTAMSFLTDKEMSPANAEETHSLLKELFNDMLKGITTEREITRETVLKTMEESPFMTAEKALTLGFIDGINYYDTYESVVLSRVGENTKRYRITEYIEYLKAEENSQSQEQDVIALIYGTGIIQNGPKSNTLTEGFLTSDTMQKAFEAAIKNPKVKAIIFRVNSPGGSGVVSDSIARYVQIAQEHNIPVIASLGDAAASGGYWIVAGCNKIIAQPMTITGSIGVLGGKLVLAGLFHNLDINFGTVAEGPNGSFWSFSQDFTDQQWALLQDNLDEVYKQFIQRVVDGRKLSIDHVKQIAKGRVWSGCQAKQYGLVDELGGFDKAIEVAKQEAKIPLEQEVKVIVYPKPKSFFEQLRSYYDEDLADGTNAVRAVYNTLCKLAVLIQTQSQPNPVLAPVPDKIN
jgi:protease-4